jgi:replicative DNA helicase
MTNPTDLFLHNPAQSTSNYVKWVEWLQDAPKIDYGCILDKHIIPLHPGDLMAVVARPGHGKSSFMAYMAKRAAKKITERGDDKKCVIYVSWEQSVEEIEAFFQSGTHYNSTDLAWGRVNLDTVKERAIKRVNLPVWMIGYSIGDTDKRRPPLTIDMVYETIRQMKYEYKYEPVLICLDYLQIIPTQKRMKRLEQVTEATIQAKHLAMEIGVPIIAGVQAGRNADNRNMQIPTMADAQWSSAIEQTADKQIALLRPIKIKDEGEVITIAGQEYTVDDQLLIIKLLKQRFDVGFGAWAVRFEPQTLTVSDYITVKLDY